MKTLKTLKTKLKNHLMTLGVVVAVCGALMIIIPTSWDKETTTEQTGYSEEYLETYGAEVWMYTIANQDPTDLDGALKRAKDMCELLYNTTDEQRAENMQRNWEKLKAN